MWQARLAAAGAGVVLAASALFSSAAMAKPAVGDTVEFPEVTLMDGRVLPAGYFKGKPVVLSYWASWCPYCARQNPYVQKLWNAASGKGLEVLAVSIDRHEAEARDYIDKRAYTFPVAMDTPALREVFGKRKTIPKIIVITSEGRVAEVIPGEMFEEDVLDLIKYAPSGSQK